jgi:hypothetical protein
MLDDDLLKQLHHVLLEVSQYTLFPFSPMMSFVDPRRRRFDDMSKLWAHVSRFKRDPKYGPRLPFCSHFQRCHFSLFITLPVYSYWQRVRLGSILLV